MNALRRRRLGAIAFGAALALGAPSHAGKCPPDSVAVGPVCVDKYEASVWRIPAGNGTLVGKVQKGKASLADLTLGGATRLGTIPIDSCNQSNVTYGSGFPLDGQWTTPVYAVSIPGVLPSTCITWFQAEQACRLAGKRLLTNAEWQAAVAGTVDPGDAIDDLTNCATNASFATPTGSRTKCVSRWGAYDMVGNVWEWVAEWGEIATGCATWASEMGSDMSCVGANSPGSGESVAGRDLFEPEPRPVSRLLAPPDLLARRLDRRVGVQRVEVSPVTSLNLPAGIIRGGNYAVGSRNGVFAIYAGGLPSSQSRSIGFRCAR
jgi:hypothetical protein